jgi:parallel beta-helix repeat protein
MLRGPKFLSITIAIVMLGHAGLTAVPATAGTYEPVADTYVDASKSTRNFGTAPSLRVDGSPELIAYLRFEISEPATSAELRFRAETATRSGFDIWHVPDDAWTETGTTYATRPQLGDHLGSTGPVAADTWIALTISPVGEQAGPVSFAITTPGSTAVRITSREGATPPQLVAPAPQPADHFTVEPIGSEYVARGSDGSEFLGSVKFVVEAAVLALGRSGGGTVEFSAGTFDLGTGQFEFYDVEDLVFRGAGTGLTIIRNDTDAARDTEPFDFVRADRIALRDLTVSAGGTSRSTSDAIDLDDGNDVLIERVEVVASRARGIVFDGKNDADGTADRNIVRDCVIRGVPSDGIELLGSRDNLIEGCLIEGVGGHGIQLAASSSVADQPNKSSDRNLVRDNVVREAGADGLNLFGGSDNVVTGNTIRNSADQIPRRDGIRIDSREGLTCNGNRIFGNDSSDDQQTPTQRYGINISSPYCIGTVIGDNLLTGNVLGPIWDAGVGTIYETTDLEAPAAPTGLRAEAVDHQTVRLEWTEATDNIGVTAYEIYRDDAVLGSVDGDTTAMVDAGARPDTTYTYYVVARDGAGNSSEPSNTATVTTAPAPTEVQRAVVADSYVNESSPSRNYGTATSVRIDGEPRLVTYLRFDLSGITVVDEAVLRIYATSRAAVGFDVRTASDDWSEREVTFQNAPQPDGDIVVASGPFGAEAWVEVDVTSLILPDRTITLMLATEHPTAVAMASRESGTGAQLILRRSETSTSGG